MTLRLRSDQNGFALVELLVAMLIVGILAAIAIPAFLDQQEKGQDSAAKSMSRNAASAAVAFATDGSGSFTGMTIRDLRTVEPSLRDAGSVATVAALVGRPSADSFTVATRSKSGIYYSLTRDRGRAFRCSSAAAPRRACATSNW